LQLAHELSPSRQLLLHLLHVVLQQRALENLQLPRAYSLNWQLLRHLLHALLWQCARLRARVQTRARVAVLATRLLGQQISLKLHPAV